MQKAETTLVKVAVRLRIKIVSVPAYLLLTTLISNVNKKNNPSKKSTETNTDKSRKK